MSIHFVVHEDGDGVGVVVVEGIKSGQELTGWIMEQDKDIKVVAKNDIPIGHKLSLERLRRRRHGDQVRRRHRPRRGPDQARRAPARAQRQDQAVVSNIDGRRLRSFGARS